MAGQQQSQSSSDNSLAPLWYTVGVVLIALAIWYFAHPQIVAFFFAVKLFEIKLIALFTSALAPLEAMMHSVSPLEYSTVSFEELIATSTKVGEYLRYPVVVILFVLGGILYFGNPVLRFKKTYSMQRLLDDEKDNWPQIQPIAKMDLVEEDIDKGPWAMAMTPMQFAKKYQLLVEERPAPGESTVFSRKERIIATVLAEEARKVFGLQLGSFWTGVEDLKIHTQALFAVFATRIVGDREDGVKLLEQIAVSSGSGKLDFSGTKELLNKYRNDKRVVKITQEHAYVLTVMASMLKEARRDGVLATADFLWLKPVDRPLWYMLNAVGRQTPFAEVAGPFAHWLAEIEFGRRLYVPMVDEAVKALEKGIKEMIYVPDEVEARR